jgi:uncharacterized ion transporter superfamily protein YfcC
MISAEIINHTHHLLKIQEQLVLGLFVYFQIQSTVSGGEEEVKPIVSVLVNVQGGIHLDFPFVVLSTYALSTGER